MSFLGCVGLLMGGSGIEELLELVCAKNAVGHMFNGKAISRAIEGYLLVDAAFNTLLVCKTFHLLLTDTTGLDSEALKTQIDQVDLEEEEETIEGLLYKIQKSGISRSTV